MGAATAVVRFATVVVAGGVVCAGVAGCGDSGHRARVDGSIGDATGNGIDAAAHDARTTDAPLDSYVCIPPPDAGVFGCMKILLLGDPGEDSSSNFEAYVQGIGTAATRIANPDVLDATLLADYNIVILDQLERTFTADEAAALTTWLTAGNNGVMAMSGYTGAQSDIDRPNSLVAGMGVDFTGGLLNGPVVQFATHPTTKGLTSVTFAGGFPVEIAATPPASSTQTYVATIDTGSEVDVAVAATLGSGRIYLWGDEWVTFDSEWEGSTQIQMFWSDVLSWLGHFS
jgi:hypothetical protein